MNTFIAIHQLGSKTVNKGSPRRAEWISHVAYRLVISVCGHVITSPSKMYSESKKSHLGTFGNFSKMAGNFSTKFYVPIMRSYLRRR